MLRKEGCVLCVLMLGVVSLTGCATRRVGMRFEDELIREFGSYANACEAKVTIYPHPCVNMWLVELSREDRLNALEMLRNCTRYCDIEALKSMEEKRECKSRGFKSVEICAMEMLITAEDKEFRVWFSENGFLLEYLCPSPDTLMEVNCMLKQFVVAMCEAFKALN